MFVTDIGITAVRGMLRHKLRLFLSLIGVVIGTAAVIASVAVVEGGRREVWRSLDELGANLVFLRDSGDVNFWRGSSAHGEQWFSWQDMLTLPDIEVLKENLPGIKVIEPQLLGWGFAYHHNREVNTEIEGSTEAGKGIRHLTLAQGRYISPDDLKSKAKVCVLGATVSRKFFGDQNPLGKNILMYQSLFRVVGITRPKGDLRGFDYDRKIIIPITTAQQRSGTSVVNAILIQARDSAAALALKESLPKAVLDLLQGRKLDELQVFCQDELQEKKRRILATLKAVVMAIAGISLVVSGIGIMNIMLVSVVERTREIGIRKAVGARDRDIVFQFLLESVLICLLGGVLGIPLGIFLARQAAKGAVLAFSETGHWAPVFSPLYCIIALGCELAIGILAGLFPAYQASKLDPADALRHE